MILSFAVAFSTVFLSPCELVSKTEAEQVLRGSVVDVPASEIGEETAPSCLWATAGRASEVKLSIWTKDELPVVGMADAAGYYAKLMAEDSGATPLDNVGTRAFSSFTVQRNGKSSGVIVVLKGERLFSFEFGHVRALDAKALVTRVIGRV